MIKLVLISFSLIQFTNVFCNDAINVPCKALIQFRIANLVCGHFGTMRLNKISLTYFLQIHCSVLSYSLFPLVCFIKHYNLVIITFSFESIEEIFKLFGLPWYLQPWVPQFLIS